MASISRTVVASLSTFLLVLPGLSGCGGAVEDQKSEATDRSAQPITGEDAADGERLGILTVQGDPLAAPGEFEMRTSCSYSRGNGAFSFGMRPGADRGIEKGAVSFGVRAGWAPGSSVPLEDGTYRARFEYEEASGSGRVPSYLGEAEMTLRIVDEQREDFPVVEVAASGSGEGISFRVHGRCQTMVTG